RLPGCDWLYDQFNVSIEFGCSIDEMRLPAEALGYRIATHRPFMNRFLLRKVQKEAKVDRDNQRLRDRVKSWLEVHLSMGQFHLDEIARALQTTPRSLQRHLRQDGATIRALVDEVRCDQARILLTERRSVAEVSSALGYSEPAAFHRAFKRWTGQTPRDFQAQRHRRARGKDLPWDR
ncbi:MAG: AraC family transcriptional regulator, partial [Myxococcota bacterium]